MDTSLALPNEGMFDRIGLTESPFPVTPDASHYFCSQRLESHVLELMHCIHMRKGFLLFTADVGLGKSTLSRYLINNLEVYNTVVSLVLNTFLQGVELLKAINEDFGLKVEGGVKEQLDGLNSFLLEQYSQERNCLIIIDDAQNLSTESLEMIRLISNFEVSTHKLVQILLIAQPEIMLTINLPQIRQLKSRIALHIELAPFTEKEVQDYVYFRLNGAGNYNNIELTKKAIKCLHKLSNGYPRRINLIMDRVLYALLIEASHRVDDKLIVLANNDLEQTQRMINFDKGARQNRKFNAYAASFIAVIGLSILFWHYGSEDWIKNVSLNNVIATESYASTPLANNKTDANLANDTIKLSELPGLVSIKNQPVNKPEQPKNIELLTFLNHYGLESLLTEIDSVVQQQDWHLMERLTAQQGWSLLVNEKPFIEPARKVLSVAGNNQKKYWLMLWKPKLSFEKYHFGLQSKQVAVLQKLLKKEGFFNKVEDAVVGSQTMFAVAQFQRSIGVEPTGKADSLTLYFLTKDNSALATLL